MATDETRYPGAVFRMQHCYVHDGNGGNNVKSRAERNEIYYNWIEGALLPRARADRPRRAVAESLKREDSDVVGNVFRKAGRTPSHFVARRRRRHRADRRSLPLREQHVRAGQGSDAAFRVFDRIETLEMHNNVFHRVGGGALTVLRTAEMGEPAALITGSNNWFPTSSEVPGDFSGSRFGADPGFVNLDGNDLRPAASSPLVDQGQANPPTPSAHPFPTPLQEQAFVPACASPTGARPRATVGALDLGAFESGEPAASVPMAEMVTGPAAAPATAGVGTTEPAAPADPTLTEAAALEIALEIAPASVPTAAAVDEDPAAAAGGCSVAGQAPTAAAAPLLGLALAGLAGRRRRK